MRRFLIPLFVAGPASLVPASANGSSVQGAVVAEQAALLFVDGPQGRTLEGYIVIWNGSNEPVYLTEVSSDAFRSVRFVRRPRTGDVGAQETLSAFGIPPHAELMMLPGAVRLQIEPETALHPGDEVTLQVSFSEGPPQSLTARVKSDASALRRHVHDPGNLEPNAVRGQRDEPTKKGS